MTNFLFEGLGWLGSICFLLAYYMLIRGKWRSDQAVYHWFNVVGGMFFVANGAYYSAWAVIFINLVWGLIACYGLFLVLGKKKGLSIIVRSRR